MSPPSPIVLDASAVLAFLQEEPGHLEVEAALHDHPCLVTAANQCEIVAKLLDRDMPPETIDAVVADLGYQVVDVTAEDGHRAGHWRSLTRAHGLSLGDRLCLAVAARLQAPVLTADRPWLALADTLNVHIRCLRPGAH
ncbi:type II toxin-antitoxin system VapC family toxin [uncultured Pseudacidovorax sp.]|uniref:type II toxin-antitoxin system VapC family toxin n=1 Tax=uncultured Pseudacidovorax sp. TaxID=679313 RepID=UPI0025D5CAA2|nr:type II toxin-antitoxin system VapC family toxin [uncultured Pseudacidovorax sp.]